MENKHPELGPGVILTSGVLESEQSATIPVLKGQSARVDQQILKGDPHVLFFPLLRGRAEK
jgi:hypothetical protein